MAISIEGCMVGSGIGDNMGEHRRVDDLAVPQRYMPCHCCIFEIESNGRIPGLDASAEAQLCSFEFVSTRFALSTAALLVMWYDNSILSAFYWPRPP